MESVPCLGILSPAATLPRDESDEAARWSDLLALHTTLFRKPQPVCPLSKPVTPSAAIHLIGRVVSLRSRARPKSKFQSPKLGWGQFELGDGLKNVARICRHLQQFSKIISVPTRPLPAAR